MSFSAALLSARNLVKLTPRSALRQLEPRVAKLLNLQWQTGEACAAMLQSQELSSRSVIQLLLISGRLTVLEDHVDSWFELVSKLSPQQLTKDEVSDLVDAFVDWECSDTRVFNMVLAAVALRTPDEACVLVASLLGRLSQELALDDSTLHISHVLDTCKFATLAGRIASVRALSELRFSRSFSDVEFRTLVGEGAVNLVRACVNSATCVTDMVHTHGLSSLLVVERISESLAVPSTMGYAAIVQSAALSPTTAIPTFVSCMLCTHLARRLRNSDPGRGTLCDCIVHLAMLASWKRWKSLSNQQQRNYTHCLELYYRTGESSAAGGYEDQDEVAC